MTIIASFASGFKSRKLASALTILVRFTPNFWSKFSVPMENFSNWSKLPNGAQNYNFSQNIYKIISLQWIIWNFILVIINVSDIHNLMTILQHNSFPDTEVHYRESILGTRLTTSITAPTGINKTLNMISELLKKVEGDHRRMAPSQS